ncbi:hypothetical protein DdX_13745 [Ditylenchus destructor]|uniref:Uncharacterized protein n=1 Tax=Ditylenchus destructor TaxID=166010 RepID=A0AAD4MSF0_9BILA|nr:hypothetical protein DdX_13745 [Ditylenchus destructor]
MAIFDFQVFVNFFFQGAWGKSLVPLDSPHRDLQSYPAGFPKLARRQQSLAEDDGVMIYDDRMDEQFLNEDDTTNVGIAESMEVVN